MTRRRAGGAHRTAEPRQQSSATDRPNPVQEALADRAFMDGVRAAIAETDLPVPLREIQERERARRAARRV